MTPLTETWLARLKPTEGGYTNDPADPGGETNWGITAFTARAFGYKGNMAAIDNEVPQQIFTVSVIATAIFCRLHGREFAAPRPDYSYIENILHMMHLTQEPDEDETPMTQEQREAMERSDQTRMMKEKEKKKRDIDLHGLVEAAKLGREHKGAILEIHPKTLKDDPILGPVVVKTVRCHQVKTPNL